MPAMCHERERLIGYLYGEGEASDQRAVEAHLADCETCRDELNALRGVRADLLAWDVPEHGSVWTPFVKARPVPFWRLMPAWGMAAAASLVFVIGAAGGAATRAFFAAPAVASAAIAPGVADAGVRAVPVSVSQADLDAFGARLLATVRGEMDQRVISAHAASMATDDARVLQRVKTMLTQSEHRQAALVNGVSNELVRSKQGTQAEVDALRHDFERLMGSR